MKEEKRDKSPLGLEPFLVALFFGFLTFLFFRDFIIRGEVPFSGLLDVLPSKYRAFSALMDGRYPKWNPYILLGLPFAGDNHSNPLDIFNLSFLFLEPVRAYVVSLMAVFFLGQVSFYVFARRALGLAVWPAAVGSAVFILNGFLIEIFALRSSFAPIAATPLALMLFARGVDWRSYSYSIWCGAFCAALLFMGIISWSVNLFMLFGLYALYRGLAIWRNGEGVGAAARPAAFFFVTLAAFLTAGAIELVPMVQLAANSHRFLISGGYSNTFPIEYLGGLVFPARVELPAGLGYIINFPSGMYMGAAGLALAALGAARCRSRGSLFYLGLMAVSAAAFFALFRIGAVRSAWGSIPLLGSQQLTRFMVMAYPLSAAALVAFGLQYLKNSLSDAAEAPAPAMVRYLVLALIAVNLMAAGLFAIFHFAYLLLGPLVSSRAEWFLGGFISPGVAAHPYPSAYYEAKALDAFRAVASGAVFWGIAAAVAVRLASLASLRSAIREGGMLSFYLVSVLLVADLFQAQSYRFYDPGLYREPAAVASLRGRMSPGARAAVLSNADFPDARSAGFDYENMKARRLKYEKEHVRKALYPNMLMFFGVPEAGGTYSLYYWRYLSYIDNIGRKVDWRQGERSRLRNMISFKGEPDGKLLDMLGMKYVISREPLPSPRFKPLDGGNGDPRGLYLYENLGAMVRAYVVRGEKVSADDAEVLMRLKADDFDPRREALIHIDETGRAAQAGRDASKPGGAGANVPGRLDEDGPTAAEAEITDYRPNRVEIKAAGFEGAYLVLSDNYFPGWKAKVDGRPAEVLRANYLMRAVGLGPGEHRVEFYFDPPAFKAGAAVTASALAFILAHLLISALRMRRNPARGLLARTRRQACLCVGRRKRG